MTTATSLITEIQRDKRFRATRPTCMEDCALSDAVLLALGGTRFRGDAAVDAS